MLRIDSAAYEDQEEEEMKDKRRKEQVGRRGGLR
jgi:hypothetical protein